MLDFRSSQLFVMLFAVTLWCLPSSIRAEGFRVFAWNVESNRPGQSPSSDSTVISNELIEMLESDETKSQIIALSEVEPKAVLTYAAAAKTGLGSDVDFVTSASGGFLDSDTLMLIVDKSRFEILQAFELQRYAGVVGNIVVDDDSRRNVGTVRARSPLIALLRDKTSGEEFWVSANHLARGDADLRTQQATMLRKWAADQSEPVIAAGDFNFDYDFNTEKGNAGFDAMLADDTWQWLKPNPLVDSNWSRDRNVQDQNVDRFPDSILDFVFVAQGAKQWHGVSDVVVRTGDFPDDERTSDHRPIIATFQP